ncbi:MAG: hypothetical protein ACFFDT_30610 [Candidatus Hodarchaeota archaeon]
MPYNYAKWLELKKGITVVYDDSGNHNLRIIPLFLRAGYRSFTYPYSWRLINAGQRDAFRYKFFLSSRAPNEDLPDPLVIVTTQNWENRYSYNSISYMVNKALEKRSDLVIVCDSRKFQLAGSHRPLIEEEFIKSGLVHYGDLYNRYCKAFKNSMGKGVGFPLLDSKNVFLQECATFMQINCQMNIKTIKDLHETLAKTPENPLWIFWSNILKTKYGSSIPVDLETSGFINFVTRRLEFQKKRVKHFVHDLRRVPERYFHPDKREFIALCKSETASRFYKDILEEYWKKNDHK